MKLVVAFANDHAGVALKQALMDEARALGADVLNLGTDSTESVDYPDYGSAIAETVGGEQADFGVAICGSGIGISIAANRREGVRAALCQNAEMAELARKHNDANILALGARFIGEEEAKACLRTFLNTEFEGGRHERRVKKLG